MIIFKLFQPRYELTVEGYSGTAGHAFDGHSGMAFSTFDRDQV